MGNYCQANKIKDHAADIEAYATMIQRRCNSLKKDIGADVPNLRIISPTGKPPRGKDVHGSGAYGASRDKGTREHEGTDYAGVPGQDIKCPISGAEIVREAKPHAGPYSGLQIKNPHMRINLFYFEPDRSLIGKRVSLGTVIGKMQDISKLYSGITPHVHLRILSLDSALLVQ